MRRLVFIVCAAFAAVSFVFLATLSAGAEPTAKPAAKPTNQYAPSDGSETTAPKPGPESSPESSPGTSSSPEPPASPEPEEPSGVARIEVPPPPAEVDEPDAAGLADRVANTVAADPYTQVVDDASRKRFSARGWKDRKKAGAYRRRAHEAVGRRASDARFKVKIPEAGYYTVYARWPAGKNAATTRIGVATSRGMRWEKVDQRSDGASWVRVGAFRMDAGDRYAVHVAPGRGVGRKDKSRGAGPMADAVMISKNVLVGKNAQMVSVGGPRVSGSTASGTGGAVVDTARRHLGKPYDFDHAPCGRTMAREDCSCLTRNVYLSHGVSLPDSPVSQWYMDAGSEVRGASSLRPGDLVFHDLTRDGDLRDHYADHVSIYSGNGNIIHASSYFGEVVESQERYLNDLWGAKRFEFRKTTPRQGE